MVLVRYRSPRSASHFHFSQFKGVRRTFWNVCFVIWFYRCPATTELPIFNVYGCRAGRFFAGYIDGVPLGQRGVLPGTTQISARQRAAAASARESHARPRQERLSPHPCSRRRRQHRAPSPFQHPAHRAKSYSYLHLLPRSTVPSPEFSSR